MTIRRCLHQTDPWAIALDCDGVLLDFITEYERIGSLVLGRPLTQYSKKFLLSHRYNLTEKEAEQVWEAMCQKGQGFWNLKPYPGAVEAVRTLQRMGHRIHIVTAIPETLREARAYNLAQVGLNPDSMHLTDKDSKRSTLFDLAPSMFVDDRLANLREAPFIPHRAWVDLGDDQDGHVLADDVYYASGLKPWVLQWGGERARVAMETADQFGTNVIPLGRARRPEPETPSL